VAGGLHKHPRAWQKILVNHPFGETILDWITSKVDIEDFVRHFKGSFENGV
jgi:hypothetical protein